MKRRNRRKYINPLGFAKLEPRQLLAGVIGAENLIVNGDFSDVPTASIRPNFYDSDSVSGWNAANDAGGQQIVLYTFANENGTILKLDSTADQIDDVFQDVPTVDGSSYIVTFDLRGQSPEGNLVTENVEVYWNDALIGEFQSTGIWTTHSMIVTGGANGTSRLAFRESLAGAPEGGNGLGVMIDNVNVALTSDTGGVTNGSFETVTGSGPFFSNGNVAGWSALDRGGRPDLIQVQPDGDNANAPATEGNNVLNLDTTGEIVDHVFADFATEQGTRYFITFDMFADGPQDENPDEVRVRWKTPDSAISTDQWIATVFGTNAWQSYGFFVEGLGDLSRLELREPGGQPGDGSGALIDNVRLFDIQGVVNDLAVDANGDADGTAVSVDLVQGVSSELLTPNVTLEHTSGPNLTSATVTVAESIALIQDSLSVDLGSSGLSQNYDSSTGELAVTGTATVAEYQTVLRTLRYTNTATSPTLGTREITLVVADDTIIGTDQSSEPVNITLTVVSNSLSIAPIAAQTVEAGSPLIVTLDITNPADVPVQLTGVSGDASILTPRFENGESWRLNISSPDATTDGQSTPIEGEMTFQLFENIFGSAGARATDRIRTLTNDGFFDDTIFHRVDQDFVIQGGDPTGTGRGGSDLGDFDDQFSTLLQHNRSGLLSYAKNLDDTNDSQFFITDGPARFLDFQHSIFGVLTTGEELRESISFVDIITDPINPLNDEFPANEVRITSAEIFQDNTKAALLLVAPEGVTGETTLTVTARDANGNETELEIAVNIVAPTSSLADSNPFLDDIPDLDAFFDVERTYQLTSQDVENDSVRYLDIDQINQINAGLPTSLRIQIPPTFSLESSFEYSVDIDTGLVTLKPGSIGESPDTVTMLVGVAQSPRPGEGINNSNVDLQVVTVNVRFPS